MALIYYTQDFRVYEETRDQPMPGPFPAPPIFFREKPWGRGCGWVGVQGGKTFCASFSAGSSQGFSVC